MAGIAGFFSDPLGAGQSVDCGDALAISRLCYQFPVGSGFTATIGARVRQDEMLAAWPSVYPSDTMIDFFTYAGAPGAYSTVLGAGVGLMYTSPGGFSASLNYVSANADNGNPSGAANPTLGGGVMTQASQESFTAQLGYIVKNWGVALAYTFAQNVGFNGTTLAGLNGAFGSFGTGNGFSSATGYSTNSFALGAFWQPEDSGWIPSVSVGWGYNNYSFPSGTTFANSPLTGTPVSQS
ncbi:MAG: hypothetical protein ACKOCM_07800 [Cyanobacteriota bacterium]